MTRADKHENFMIRKIDNKHAGVVLVGKAKEGKFARKCSAKWSKTHIVSVTVKRRTRKDIPKATVDFRGRLYT